MDLQTLLFSFGGRINRAKYWLVVLFTVIATVMAIVIGAIVGGVVGQDAGFPVAIVVGLAVGIFSIWVGVAAGVKRLHDREKSGWWLLLFYLVPGILNGVSSATDTGGLVFALVGFGISVWGFIELGCLKGTAGPNAYGPDPLPAEAAA